MTPILRPLDTAVSERLLEARRVDDVQKRLGDLIDVLSVEAQHAGRRVKEVLALVPVEPDQVACRLPQSCTDCILCNCPPRPEML